MKKSIEVSSAAIFLGSVRELHVHQTYNRGIYSGLINLRSLFSIEECLILFILSFFFLFFLLKGEIRIYPMRSMYTLIRCRKTSRCTKQSNLTMTESVPIFYLILQHFDQTGFTLHHVEFRQNVSYIISEVPIVKQHLHLVAISRYI